MFYEASVTDLTNDNQPIVSFRNSLNTSEEYFSMGHATGGSAAGAKLYIESVDSDNSTPLIHAIGGKYFTDILSCLLYTSPSPRDS